MSEQGLIQAERRVREMNRVTRQYTEQGNRFMQQIQQVQNMRNNQTRFEQVIPNNNNNTYNSGNNVPQNPQMQKMQNGGRRQQNMQTVQSAQTVQNTQNVQNGQNAQYAQNRQTVRSEADGCSAAAKNYPAGNTQAWNGAAGMLPLLSDLNLDGEKLMIILIMYLLIKEKADIKLILALGYLLL